MRDHNAIVVIDGLDRTEYPSHCAIAKPELTPIPSTAPAQQHVQSAASRIDRERRGRNYPSRPPHRSRPPTVGAAIVPDQAQQHPADQCQACPMRCGHPHLRCDEQRDRQERGDVPARVEATPEMPGQ